MPKMLTHDQATVVVRPKGTAETRRREEAAKQVLLEFGKLPTGRLLCFFDEEDWGDFKNEDGFGKANRAVSGVVTRPTDLQDWPSEVVERIYPSLSLNNNERAFDFVTYLHNSSCEDPVGMTMTFAHELQHFVQWATMRKAWIKNQRFKDWCRNFDTGLVSHDLPIEIEARIVAKRIAIRIHGREAVDRYIEKNIATPVDDLDGRNWLFIKGLDVSKLYDVEVETELLDTELKSRPLPQRI
jgi:hypothetical protein